MLSTSNSAGVFRGVELGLWRLRGVGGFPAGRYGWKPWKMICIYKYVKKWIYIYIYNIHENGEGGGTKTLRVVLEVWCFEPRFFLATLEFNHSLKTLGTVFLFDYLCQWSGSSITLKKVWWIDILVHVDDILSLVECCAEKTGEHKQYVVWWSPKRAWRVASVIYTQEATKYIQILKMVVWKCLEKCDFLNILGKLSYPSLSMPDFQGVSSVDLSVFFGHVHLNISMIRFRFSGILGQVLGWRNMPSEV